MKIPANIDVRWRPTGAPWLRQPGRGALVIAIMSERTHLSFLNLLEISQIRSSLILLGRHQQSVSTQHIILVAYADV
jgi:hypothetical protein